MKELDDLANVKGRGNPALFCHYRVYKFRGPHKVLISVLNPRLYFVGVTFGVSLNSVEGNGLRLQVL